MPNSGILIIRHADPAMPQCRDLIAKLDELQASLYPAHENYLDSIEELQKPNCYFLAAYLDEQIVGCGALKTVDGRYSELKRMYVASDRRKHGIGQRLLEELEARSASIGVFLIRLETGTRQPEALALYGRNGYKEIEAFGDYAAGDSSIYMEKCLQQA